MNEISENTFLSKQPYNDILRDFNKQESLKREDSRSTRPPPVISHFDEHDFHSIYDI